MSDRDSPTSLVGVLTGPDGRILSAIALGSVSALAGRLAVPALLPTLIGEWGIGSGEAGLAITAIIGGMGLSQYVGGRLSDDLSRLTVLVAAVAAFGVGYAALALAPLFGLFLAGAAAVGVAHGLYLPPSLAMLTELFSANRGAAFGINAASVQLGSAVGPALVAGALLAGNWRLAFLPVLAGLALTGGLLHAWRAEPYVLSGGVSLELRATAARVVRIGPVRRTMVAFGIFGFLWEGAINFVPTFLEIERGFSPTAASTVFGAVFLLSMVGNPVAGSLGDRYDHPTVAAGAVLLGTAGLAGLLLAESFLATAAAVWVFGLGLSSFWPPMDAFVMSQLPDDSMGGDFGALNTATLAVGSLGPIYVGVAAERVGYAATFATLAVPIAACLGLLLLLRRDADPAPE